MNEEELRRRLPNASGDFLRLNAQTGAADIRTDDAGAPAKPKRIAGHGTLGPPQVKVPTGQHFLVVVTSYRKRLLDEDNLIEKYHVDLCRYAGILPADSPGTAKIEVKQEKVGPKEPERVSIQIYAV